MFRYLLLLSLISCTNELPTGKGYFKSLGRMPASKKNAPDMIQTLVYCKTNSEKPKRCFYKYHKGKKKKLYTQVSRELNQMARKLYAELLQGKADYLEEKVQKCMGEFTEFQTCLQNASTELNQEVVVKFTQDYKDQHNGHEIHYLKNLYQNWLLTDLEKFYLQGKGEEEKAEKKELSLAKQKYTDEFIKNPDWLKGASDWTLAREKCVEHLPVKKMKYFTTEEYKTVFLRDYLCTDILYQPQLAEKIEKKAYNQFEKKLGLMFKNLEHELTLSFNDCLKSKKSEDTCFEKSWDKMTPQVTQKWLKFENYRTLASDEDLVKSRMEHQKSVFKNKLLLNTRVTK